MTPPRRVRVVRPTLLIVGEGYAEKFLLQHLRSIYTANMQGPSVTIANARGKGAKNVINQAVALARGYSAVGALFDTDTDWSAEVEKHGQKNGVLMFAATPCLEGLLLDIVGTRPLDTAAANKQAFLRRFNGNAHEEKLIARHFNKEMFDQARSRIDTLNALLDAFGQQTQ